MESEMKLLRFQNSRKTILKTFYIEIARNVTLLMCKVLENV